MGALGLSGLNDYVNARRNWKFNWGQHDCLTFTNGAWRVMHGVGWSDDWQGRYLKNGKPMLPSSLRREFGFDSFEEAVATKLTPCSGVPPRGALVSSPRVVGWVAGIGLGVSLGQSAVFVGEFGLVFEKIERVSGAWI